MTLCEEFLQHLVGSWKGVGIGTESLRNTFMATLRVAPHNESGGRFSSVLVRSNFTNADDGMRMRFAGFLRCTGPDTVAWALQHHTGEIESLRGSLSAVEAPERVASASDPVGPAVSLRNVRVVDSDSYSDYIQAFLGGSAPGADRVIRLLLDSTDTGSSTVTQTQHLLRLDLTSQRSQHVSPRPGPRTLRDLSWESRIATPAHPGLNHLNALRFQSD